MFRTSPVHHQERFVEAVFADFGMWYYCAYYSTRPAITKLLLKHIFMNLMICFAHAWMGFLCTRIYTYFCEEHCSNRNMFQVVHNTNAVLDDHTGPSTFHFSQINCPS